MGSNLVIKRLKFGDSWIAPAGVYKVEASVYTTRNKLIACGSCNIIGTILAPGPAYSSIALMCGSDPGNSLIVSAYGSNGFGQLGINSKSDTPSTNFAPIDVFPADSISKQQLDVIDISTSGINSYAVLTNGQVYGCGIYSVVAGSDSGELGAGYRAKDTELFYSSSFCKIRAPSGILKISAGMRFALYLDYQGRVYGSGQNDKLQLTALDETGNFDRIPDITEIGITQDDSKIVKISSGAAHALALSETGEIYEWGNLEKLVGTPRKVGIGKKWIDISAGFNHSLAIDDIGDVYAWGKNDFGQLGDNSPINATYRLAPVKCTTTLKFKRVGARLGESSIAVTTNGDVYVWGRSIWNSTISTQPIPIKLVTPLDLKFSYAEISHNEFILQTESGNFYNANLGIRAFNYISTPEKQESNRIINVVPGVTYSPTNDFLLNSPDFEVYKSAISSTLFAGASLGDPGGLSKIIELRYYT